MVILSLLFLNNFLIFFFSLSVSGPEVLGRMARPSSLYRSTQCRSTPTSGLPQSKHKSPAHRSYHFRGVKLKSCIKKIHHNLYISKQVNVRIKHADTEGSSHKKFGTDARFQ